MIDSKAYTQVNYIIQNMSEELKKNIPQKLMSVIEKNKDNEYKIEVENIEDLDLLDDTQKILSVIYIDYIASDEEKLIIKNKERIINLKKEKEKKKKYDINVFKTQNEDKNLEEIKFLEDVVVKKEKWYAENFRKLRALLKR